MAPWNFAITFGRRRRELERGLAACILVAATAACSPTPSDDGTISVFAAASLTDVIGDLVHAMDSAHPDMNIRTNLGGSQQLAMQIAQGADADVFATADARWIDYLVERDLMSDKAEFATNRLTVVAPTRMAFRDIAAPGVRIVVGTAAAPIGEYTNRVLARMAIDPSYGPTFAAHVRANIVSEEDNVRSVLAKVLLGEADVGFVYDTDIYGLEDPAYHAVAIPAELGVSASYFVGRSTHGYVTGIDAFLQVLFSPVGQAVLRGRGFSPA